MERAQATMYTARRGLLPGEDGDWIQELRRELDSLYLRALEAYGEAALGLGGAELAAAERAGRELAHRAPYREGGHRLLMRALSRAGTRPRRWPPTRACASSCATSSASAQRADQELHLAILGVGPAPCRPQRRGRRR